MKKVIFHYLRPYYARMALGFVIKFFGTIMDLFLPWILAYIIDSVIPTGNIPLIYLYGGLMALCAVGAFVGVGAFFPSFAVVFTLPSASFFSRFVIIN